ncbi:hypothetical protein LguiA_035048 [Lonicera macranthoides]
MMTSKNLLGQFGDTTLTKVFVGGLAWETPEEALKDHFHKYGEILEAVIISDKITGRSKGYGFVTFKEAEEAKKACEDATPVINGRRANCNLASLGARRPRSSSTTPPPQHAGSNAGPRSAPSNHVQWYYPATPPPSAYHHHHQAVPNYYGYTPTYIATDVSYNHKLRYTGGAYMNMNMNMSGQYTHELYGGHARLMPMYPFYQINQTHATGLPAAHIYSTAAAARMVTSPPLLSKPTSFLPNSGTTTDYS